MDVPVVERKRIEKPILFSTEMVRAILDGRKTQTRRVIKPQPEMRMDGEIDYTGNKSGCNRGPFWKGERLSPTQCPYGQPGNILWVRETWCRFVPEHTINGRKYAYKADLKDIEAERIRQDYIHSGLPYHWKPSIHMPREASRIFLKVVNIRVEQLQNITDKDAVAEGIKTVFDIRPKYDGTVLSAIQANHVGQFRSLWDGINKKRGFGWITNPWVWVIELESIN